MTVRWAIAGPGKMAEVFAPEFAHVPDAELVAVAGRSAAGASAFAERFGIARSLTYDELYAADDIDVVYISTPHTSHAPIALAAIESGKAVLVEKSFTASVADTRAVIDAARAKGVFAMEAMWTRFLPNMRRISDAIAAGQIGEVRSVQGDLTAFRAFDPDDRLFDPAKGGGAVLDLAVYVLSFAVSFLGRPDTIQATGGLMPNGVEGEVGLLLGYRDGRFANLSVSFKGHGPGRMFLSGTQGWIDVPPRFHRMPKMTIYRGKEVVGGSDEPPVGVGYSYEIAEVTRCLQAGLTESPINPLDDTLAVQEIMEEVIRLVRG